MGDGRTQEDELKFVLRGYPPHMAASSSPAYTKHDGESEEKQTEKRNTKM